MPIELGLRRTQTCLDVSQAFPEGQLGKGHAQILIPTGEAFDLVVAVVSIDALAKFVHRKEIHQLREDRLALDHWPSPRAWMPKYGL